MELVFATNNLNKLAEVQNLLPRDLQLLSLESIGCNIDIPETQNTIEGNAIQKAEYIQQHYGYNCFADDTGLEVDALNGDPGVYSARYAGPQRNASDNMNLLLKNLKGQEQRTARFKTVIALSVDDNMHVFTGLCQGRITHKVRGTLGFGYDPIFQPNGYEQTFAEMELSLKNQIGHRGKAVLQLVNFLNQLNK